MTTLPFDSDDRSAAGNGGWSTRTIPQGTAYPILRYFTSGHLPEGLKAISKPFEDQAYWLVANLEPGPEVSAGLRKLLEAKDCFVRAALDNPKE